MTIPQSGSSERSHADVQIDTSVPHIARVYDYWLGGKDNFAVDRALAQQFIWQIPWPSPGCAAIAPDGTLETRFFEGPGERP